MAERRAVTAAELFDAIGAGYEDAFGRPPVVDRALRELRAVLPPQARVLDLGSGTGRPAAEELTAAGHHVTGLDVSPVMVELASANVPGAQFVLTDVRTWSSPPESWDAVCAYFPFLQLPRADTEAVLAKIARWLVPGGHLSLVTVPMDAEDVPVEFLGHPVRITSFTAEALRARVTAAGLEVLGTHSEVFAPGKPGARPEEHLLLTARRPE
ncbi:SAM-dependent methyltransferase [Amycolatopsis bartoniae]|uniref:Methyltransferase n=1 Tax=Amycolatopsis bartoniae TaxID=941986 RepID=A0A8H9M7G7_9PSEU|nr:class I SAM-dependent methyltransferase [Amycolatopsis bartoniae]MBB2938225.1 SAM-dependent methyltransferase [Amycolatopsis bartoniae]TVT09005.1 class I SAM-dependent methyltransferase [Amycolatopsis bartoniae]GHF33597.1 methyltransferase [Amycolatopsis bartoniae]